MLRVDPAGEAQLTAAVLEVCPAARLAPHEGGGGACCVGPQALLSAEALARLFEHDWPGNVRELENCLARAVVVAAGGVIRPEHLAIALPHTPSEPSIAPLSEVEKEHVRRAMEASRGHKARAAELLEVSRPRLNRLLEKYGLE